MAKTNTPSSDNLKRYQDLGFAISYYRRLRNMTQEELADKINVSRQHIAAIEAPNMLRPASLEMIFNISSALRVEPWLLFKFGPKE